MLSLSKGGNQLRMCTTEVASLSGNAITGVQWRLFALKNREIVIFSIVVFYSPTHTNHFYKHSRLVHMPRFVLSECLLERCALDEVISDGEKTETEQKLPSVPLSYLPPC